MFKDVIDISEPGYYNDAMMMAFFVAMYTTPGVVTKIASERKFQTQSSVLTSTSAFSPRFLSSMLHL